MFTNAKAGMQSVDAAKVKQVCFALKVTQNRPPLRFKRVYCTYRFIRTDNHVIKTRFH